MAQNLLTALTAPAQYRNQKLSTPYGDVAVPANGAVSVNTRLVPTLLKLGFTSATLPDTSNMAAMGVTVSLAAPSGVGEVHGIGNTSIKVVAGRVTVPREYVQSLVDEGFVA